MYSSVVDALSSELGQLKYKGQEMRSYPVVLRAHPPLKMNSYTTKYTLIVSVSSQPRHIKR
jgi:hypothetical protein